MCVRVCVCVYVCVSVCLCVNEAPFCGHCHVIIIAPMISVVFLGPFKTPNAPLFRRGHLLVLGPILHTVLLYFHPVLVRVLSRLSPQPTLFGMPRHLQLLSQDASAASLSPEVQSLSSHIRSCSLSRAVHARLLREDAVGLREHQRTSATDEPDALTNLPSVVTSVASAMSTPSVTSAVPTPTVTSFVPTPSAQDIPSLAAGGLHVMHASNTRDQAADPARATRASASPAYEAGSQPQRPASIPGSRVPGCDSNTVSATEALCGIVQANSAVPSPPQCKRHLSNTPQGNIAVLGTYQSYAGRDSLTVSDSDDEADNGNHLAPSQSQHWIHGYRPSLPTASAATGGMSNGISRPSLPAPSLSQRLTAAAHQQLVTDLSLPTPVTAALDPPPYRSTTSSHAVHGATADVKIGLTSTVPMSGIEHVPFQQDHPGDTKATGEDAEEIMYDARDMAQDEDETKYGFDASDLAVADQQGSVTTALPDSVTTALPDSVTTDPPGSTSGGRQSGPSDHASQACGGLEQEARDRCSMEPRYHCVDVRCVCVCVCVLCWIAYLWGCVDVRMCICRVKHSGLRTTPGLFRCLHHVWRCAFIDCMCTGVDHVCSCVPMPTQDPVYSACIPHV